jgi:hypothetical protein
VRTLLLTTLFFKVCCAYAAQNSCSLTMLQQNLDVAAAVMPEKSNAYLVQSVDPKKVISAELRVPCSEADLLKLGFQIQQNIRYNPGQSTGGGFEEVALYQKEQFALRCYFEYELDKPSENAKVLWSRSACQQIVPNRLRAK